MALSSKLLLESVNKDCNNVSDVEIFNIILE